MVDANSLDSREFLDATPDAILLVDAHGTISLINKKAESLFGYPRDELVGKEIEILVPTTLHRKHRTVRDRFSQSPHNRPMGVGLELYAVDKNGRKFPVEISLSPYQQGTVPYTIAIIRDVTQIRHAERELRKRTAEVERSNRDLEHFAMVASHDLQAPLRQLVSYCQILDEEFGSALGDTGQGYTRVIRDAAQRMQEQITGLLEYSKVGSTGQRLSGFDLRTVLAKAVHNLAVEIEHAHATVSIPDSSQLIFGDENGLLQVFQNLIANGIKYCRPNIPPLVTVTASKDETSWIFTIADNGIGIPKAEQGTVFDIFHRGSNRKDREGLGIGLAICKKIVERFEGRIWVEDNSSEGTRICFTLPARRSTD